MPKVSIIMNCYNGERYLTPALESIRKQTYEDYEIVFWDNLSVDGSPQIAAGFDDRLKYYRGERFMSLGEARNEALKMATGEYIAFLDADDLWEPDKLRLQMEIVESDPGVSFVYSNAEALFEKTQERALRLKPGNGVEGDVFKRFIGSYPVIMSTVLLRSAPLAGLAKRFDTRLNVCEEFDLFIRYLYTEKARYVDLSLATYRIHGAMTSEKHIEGVGKEYQVIIENLIQMDPCIERTHPREMRGLQLAWAFHEGKGLLYAGKSKDARKLLRKYMFLDKKVMVAYLLAFVPNGLARAIIKKYYGWA